MNTTTRTLSYTSAIAILVIFIVCLAYFIRECNSQYHEAKKDAHAHIVYGLDIVHRECFYSTTEKHRGQGFKKSCFWVIGE